MINDKITEQMKLVGISEFPFSSIQLTSCFREQINKYHPDKYDGEDANEKSSAIIEAYKELKKYADDTDIKKVIKEKGMFDFTQSCPKCEGKGFNIVDVYVRSDNKYNCIKCKDTGIYKIVKCKWCNNGKFTLKSGRIVNCKACKGTGNFKIKCNHKVSFFEEQFYFNMFGHYEYKKERKSCSWCKGTGEVKFEPVNPVISKGAILK